MKKRMKKALGILLVVMLFACSSTVFARANPCYACNRGNYVITEITYTNWETVGSRKCEHGYMYEMDLEQNKYKITVYTCSYCGDSYHVETLYDTRWYCKGEE